MDQINHVSDVIGSWGPYQANIFWFYFFMYILSPFNNLGITFHAPKMKFWCHEYVNNTFNVSDPCSGCVQWDYDEEYQSTIINEFDLVCHRSWLTSMSQSFYQFGYVINGFLLGYLSDRFGRRPVLWLAVASEITGGMLLVTSQSVIQYIVSRFLIGFGDSGHGLCLSLLLVETVGSKIRSDKVMEASFGWTIGYLILPLIAYFIRSFRLLQAIPTGIALLFAVVWLWSIPESPRWTLINGQHHDVQTKFIQAAKANRKNVNQVCHQVVHLKNNIEKQTHQSKSSSSHYSIITLLSRPKIVKTTLIFWYSFAINAFIYHGISLNVADFGGNIYINFALAGFVEIPSIVLNIFALRSIGRRTFTAVTLLIAAMTNLLIILFPSNEWFNVIIVMLGKLFIFSSFNAIYIHAGEVFPTVLRHTGMGSCSIAARFGSIFAPFIKEFFKYFHIGIVMAIFCLLSFTAAMATMLLPETKDTDIVDTLEQFEMNNLNQDENLKEKQDKI